MKKEKEKAHPRETGVKGIAWLQQEEEMQALGNDVHHLHTRMEARDEHLHPTDGEHVVRLKKGKN